MPNARFIAEPLSPDELEQFSKTAEAFRRTIEWFNEHYAELTEEYPDTWVAFSSNGVVASGPTQEDVLADLDQSAIDRGEIYTEFIPAKPLHLVL